MDINYALCVCGHSYQRHHTMMNGAAGNCVTALCRCPLFAMAPGLSSTTVTGVSSESHRDQLRTYQNAIEDAPDLQSASRILAHAIIKSDITHMAEGVDQFQRDVLGLDCTPLMLSETRYSFRSKFLEEELEEFRVAYAAKDRDGVLDALGDLIYVAYGGILEMNVPPRAVFDAIQAANIVKRRGVTKRGDQFDAMKPEGWLPPDHNILLAALELRAKVSPAFLEATTIRMERSAKYNGAGVELPQHFPLGHVSYFQMYWVKAIRLLTTMKMWLIQGVPIDRTVLRDSLLDGMNYSDFWVRELDREAKEGSKKP